MFKLVRSLDSLIHRGGTPRAGFSGVVAVQVSTHLITPVRHLVSLYTHSAAFPATWLEIGISSLHLLPYGLMLQQTPLADMADVNPQIRKSAFTTVYSQK
jgi:hypothetical protein